MGRRPSEPGAITRLRKRKRGHLIYYSYDLGGKPRKEIYLGKDYALAILEYAKLEKDRTATERVQSVITFAYVAQRYLVEVVPTKAAATQTGNIRELKQLMSFFNDPPAPLDEIQPIHVRQYLRIRSKKAKVRANREKALLSHIWNFARENGYTSLANPCAGIRGNKETGREVYIEDDVFARVYEQASAPVRDAMDVAYLTGQRVADTLKIDERDIRDGVIHIRQNKTDAKRRIEMGPELVRVLDRIAARKAGLVVRSTKLIVSLGGQAFSYGMLRYGFDDAREKAGIPKKEFQMRDLRAKAGTDKAEDSGDILKARDQLGHTTVTMTEHYIRNRRGKKVTSTK
jgi:integrase